MNAKQYIHEIADRTCLPYQYKKKIIKDLRREFEVSLAQGYSEEEIMARMGEPDDIAAGLYENFISAEEVERPFTEYKSQTEIWGMPLVHIVKAKRRPLARVNHARQDFLGVPPAKGVIAIGRRAKGIVAIGNFALGVISIGNISIGALSVSNIGIGLIAFGNVILGLLRVLGNLAIGMFAVGNLAIGYAAVGNESLGWYAIGNEAAGHMALSVGNFHYAGPEMQRFIGNMPLSLQPFFRDAVNILQNWQWAIAGAGVLLMLLIVVWIIVNRKLENGDIENA